MYKKIGIGMLLACTILVPTFNVGIVTRAYAAPCTTLAECRELERTARDNIAEILEQEEELGADLSEVQAEISDLRDDISGLENSISDLESEIAELAAELADLAVELTNLGDDIEENLEILEDIEDRIEVLIDEISERMRITQRVNNTNTFLAILSEAENLADVVRRTRMFNRIATEDAELMDELIDLVEILENTLLELEEQKDQLQEQTDQLEDQTDQLDKLRDELEVEQESLEAEQSVLIERETEMQDMLYQLNVDRMTQEEVAAAAAEAEEILARTPPPPVVSVTPVTNTSSNTTSSNNESSNNESSNSTSSNDTSSNGSTSSGASSNDTTSDTTSSNSSAQVPVSGGLAHPIPGARISSHFGPRGGRHHAGVDLIVAGNPSAPILSAAAGTITINTWHNSLGWYVVVSHNINGQRVDTLYAHLRYQSSAGVGTVVSQGQRIGTKGSTGQSTGPHLHFEVHPGGWGWGNSVNPTNWVGL